MQGPRTVIVLVFVLAASTIAKAGGQIVWEEGQARARLITARQSGPTASPAERTLNGYLAEKYGWTLPLAARADGPGLYIVVGSRKDNPVLADLAEEGVDLETAGLGDEGFRIITHEADGRRFAIVTAATPVGLKYGCQELVFFHLPATDTTAAVDWPMHVRRKPQFAYRGIYMLPCWAQHDSVESWRRVLKFNSEVTVNRNWFWLNGFPLLKRYGGEYADTDLADVKNVSGLVDLCRAEGMKFYLGGGWYTWHHAKITAGSVERGVQYYRDMVERLPGIEGIYLEPAGEGSEADPSVWRQRTQAFRRLADGIWRTRPDFEFAVAIGKFNAPGYRRAMHELDQRRVYWWWCWGDPLRDNALREHPLVLRWHTTRRMSDYHGSTEPPRPSEIPLAGFATSYDPGMGFGNPWNGRGYGIGSGVDHPREFHPHTIPYFAHQYWFRERSWDVRITKQQFAARLARRLWDADMPPEAIQHYLTLSELCRTPAQATEQVLRPIEAFVGGHDGKGTPRNRDTLARMREAIEGFRKTRVTDPGQGR
jgi:hypothetical protein